MQDVPYRFFFWRKEFKNIHFGFGNRKAALALLEGGGGGWRGSSFGIGNGWKTFFVVWGGGDSGKFGYSETILFCMWGGEEGKTFSFFVIWLFSLL